MLEKRWIIKDQPEPQAIQNLRNAINASEPLAALLLQRGIQDFDAARQLFNPTLSQSHNPFLMKDMQKAVDRITQAINEQQNILIYGDYDVDGTTSVALMFSFLSNHYDRVSYYLPDRYGEGYGISTQGIDFAADNDISLVIALDCGIKAVDKLDYANSKNIDFIICDHHLPGESLPKAAAILNPLQPDCAYPFKHLSGCGIGLKLAQALAKSWSTEETEPLQYLDLVAIAAGCDIVSMTGENRVLSFLGLKLMETAIRPGLELLLEGAGLVKDGILKRPLTITDLVFIIGPRINAAGRMAHGQQAVELLIANTKKEAEIPVQNIVANNTNRREVDLQMLDEAIVMLEGTDKNANSTVLYAEHWHKGVVGIVASRVQDHFYRPTIILTHSSDGKATGSARSVLGFDVHHAIEQCAELLDNFGGHQAAAGMTMPLENLDRFRSRFEEAVSKTILPEQLIPSITIDLALDFDQINMRFYESMNRIAPFGPDNMKPLFVSHHVFDAGNSKRVGTGEHLKLEVFQQGKSKNKIKGIAFGMGHHCDRIKEGEEFSLVYHLELNEFNRFKNLELMVKDLRFAKDQ
jgi:single-stranded-DNA-specific exonuclease